MSQSLRRVLRAAAIVRRAMTVLAAVFAATCVRDQTTAPTLRTPPSAAAHGTYTTLGTYSIPIPPTNTDGGAQPVANTGVLVPAGTYYRVRVNGTVTVSDNPEYVQWYGTPFAWEGSYGPFGTTQGELVVQLKARNTDGSGTSSLNFVNPQYNAGTSGPDSARTDVLYTPKEIEVQAGRSGISGITNDNCCHWAIGMFALTASQTVTVEQVTDVVHVVANPVAGHPNTPVTFTASRDDGGNLIIYGWHWDADPGQPSGGYVLCGYSNPCQYTVAGSGTMTAYTNLGNPTAHVVVYQATNPDTSFQLVADRSTAVIGDTVTFTPLYNGVPGPAARWRWIPTDTATGDAQCGDGVSPCRKQMIVSGRMWAFTSTTPAHGDSDYVDVTVTLPSLTVTVDRSEVGEGDTATFTGTLSPSRPAYQVVGWTWTTDTSGTLASKSPIDGVRLGASRERGPIARRLTDSTSSGDTLVNAVNDSAYMGAPIDTVQTTGCSTSTLTCAAAIHLAGRMTVVVNALGRLISSGASASVRYYCPIMVPMEGVNIQDPAVIERSTEFWDISRIYKGGATVWTYKPYTRYQVSQEGGYGKLERAKYRFDHGEDSYGWVAITTDLPWPLELSWIELECRAWLDKNAEFTGRVYPTGKVNIHFRPPI